MEEILTGSEKAGNSSYNWLNEHFPHARQALSSLPYTHHFTTPWRAIQLYSYYPQVAKVNKGSARLHKLSKVTQLVRDRGKRYRGSHDLNFFPHCSPLLTIMSLELVEEMYRQQEAFRQGSCLGIGLGCSPLCSRYRVVSVADDTCSAQELPAPQPVFS